MRAFMVKLPSGTRYWTVLDDDLRPHPAADAFLLHVRLGRGGAESTTQAYATSITLYLTWCSATGVDWREAGRRLAWFITWLQGKPDAGIPGSGRVRGARRINAILAAVREFAKHAVSVADAPPSLLSALYEQADDRWFPNELRLESAVVLPRARPRHRLPVSESSTPTVTDNDLLAALSACRSARDRFIVLSLCRLGLRRGELIGMRRGDVHALPESTTLGCTVPREHVHVRRREDNTNRAWAKSGRQRVVPMDALVVQAYDQYLLERSACPAAAECDFLLVNLFKPPVGAPMRPAAVNEQLADLSRRAGLAQSIRPHMLRHTFAANLAAAGAAVDDTQALLGHATPVSTQVYFHPSPERLRAALDAVPGPRSES